MGNQGARRRRAFAVSTNKNSQKTLKNSQKLSRKTRKEPKTGKTLHKTLTNCAATENFFRRCFFVLNFAVSKDKKSSLKMNQLTYACVHNNKKTKNKNEES